MKTVKDMLLENGVMVANERRMKRHLSRMFSERHENENRENTIKMARGIINVIRTIDIYGQIEAPITIEIGAPVENIAENNIRVARSIVSDRHSDIYVENIERDFTSRTYPIKYSNAMNYVRFISAMLDEMLTGTVKKPFTVSYDEFTSGIYKDGKREMKLGKKLARMGFSNNLIGNLDKWRTNNENEELYFTISGAMNHIIGMSYYGVGWSSCQNFDDHGYSDHLSLYAWATSQCKDAYVAFVHHSIDDLNNTYDEFMESRTTVLRKIVNGKEMFFHGKAYGNDRDVHYQIIDSMNKLGHFNSHHHNSGDTIDLNFELDGGIHRYVESQKELRVYFYGDYSHTIDCPLCNGNGHVEANLVDDDGDHVGYVDVTCPNCYGDGSIEIEIDNYEIDTYDLDDVGLDARDYNDEKRYFVFYNDHATEGFYEKYYDNQVGVTVERKKYNDFINQ